MNITRKDFGVIILVISVVLIGYGYMLATGDTARYVTWKPPYSDYEIKTFMLIGGGVIGIIVGLILVFSNEDNKTTSSNTSQGNTRYCPSCGKKYSSTSSGEFCDECGNKL